MKLTCSNVQSLINYLKQLYTHFYNTVDAHVLGTVHTYPDKFENGDFFLRFSLPFTRKCLFRAQKRCQRWLPVFVWTDENVMMSYVIYYWNCACSVREVIVLPSF